MRTIGFRSNILFAIAAAFGVVASLGRPWYGRSPAPTDAQMEDFFNGIGRAFSTTGGRSGWDSLDNADNIIAGLAIATVVLLLLALSPAIQRPMQSLARVTSIATLAMVLVKLFDEPGANSVMEPRQGVLLASACAAVLVACTMTVASAPVRRSRPAKTYTPPPAPTYGSDSSYGPQQY
jgi:hypothetical protein